MGGIDTKGRFHVHWGPPETVRRAARGIRAAPVRPAGARPGVRRTSRAVDLAAVDADPRPTTTTTRSRCSQILEATQAAYGYLPVAALKHISREDRRVVRDDLRHRLVLPPPPVRAAGRERPGRPPRPPARPTPGRRRPTSTRASAPRTRRAGPRASPPDADDPQDAQDWPRVLLARRAMASAVGHGLGRSTRRPMRRPGAFDGLRRAIHELGRGGHDRGGRGVRPARPGRRRASRPREKWRAAAAHRPRRRAYVVANGYGADPASRHRPDAPRDRPVRGHRGRC